MFFIVCSKLTAALYIRELCVRYVTTCAKGRIKSSLLLGILYSVLSLAPVDILCSFQPRAK